MTREKEWIERDLQLKTEESQQVMRENQQLQTANTQSQQQVQQLNQQVSDIIVTSSLHVVIFSSPAVSHEDR